MGSRLTASGTERVYAAADLWVKRALWIDDSLFTPGKPIWSKQVLGEVHRRFLDRPDESGDSFLEKLERQLKGGQPEVYQLMGEALYLYFLYVATKNSGKEQEVIETVLNWSPDRVGIPPGLVTSLTPGIGIPGTFFITAPQFQLAFLFELVEQLKGQELDERWRILGDPWSLKDFVAGLEFQSRMMRGYVKKPVAQREALLHLVFPDTFEVISSVDIKARIARTFSHLVANPTEDVDRQLQMIRSSLEPGHGSRDYFFHEHPEIRARWDENYKQPLWDEFVKRAKRFVDAGDLEGQEIEFKVKASRNIADAREETLAGTPGWANSLKDALISKESDFIGWRLVDDLIKWCDAHEGDASRALRAIWAENDSSVSDRIRAFRSGLPRSVISGPGNCLKVASGLLMGIDVERYPLFMKTVFDKAYDRTGFGRPQRGADEAALYEHALAFLDRFIEESAERGLELRHRLDAQSVVWELAERWDDWGSERVVKPGLDPHPPDPWSPANIDSLAQDLLWEPDYLQKIIDGLQDKRQAIFQGPPGTGKTYVAKRIAEHCREHGGDFRIMQFHPSYSYEDFVEGFRPTLTAGGQAGFELRKGPLRSIAEDAAAKPDATYILVIDEINRGNVAKVLGELYFLLEYRDEKVNLQYSSDAFSLPANLWFIGTMNTTDRSIALVDAALRRRFYFFGFYPDEPPVKGLLRRWLEDNKSDFKWVADLVDTANRDLGDRHMGIGPSHFMKNEPPIDEDRVRFIWEQAVMPYIEEQCFGDEARLKEFAYDHLKRELDRKEQPEDGDGNASD